MQHFTTYHPIFSDVHSPMWKVSVFGSLSYFHLIHKWTWFADKHLHSWISKRPSAMMRACLWQSLWPYASAESKRVLRLEKISAFALLTYLSQTSGWMWGNFGIRVTRSTSAYLVRSHCAESDLASDPPKGRWKEAYVTRKWSKRTTAFSVSS